VHVVAIHQPNFLPWLGFFEKFDRADTFVLLDEVQLARRSATTRVGIMLNGERHTLSLPVRHSGDQSLRICDSKIDSANPLLRKGVASLERAYSRCEFWSPVGDTLVEFLRDPPDSLLDLNVRLIETIADALGIDLAKVRLQSSLGGGSGRKSELMASLTRAAGGDVYLSGGHDPSVATEQGPSGADYNDPAVFRAHGVELCYQSFSHPVYEQGLFEFVPGLTAFDAFARLGPETLAVIRRNNPSARSASNDPPDPGVD
jgi:WbqC-like protein family